MNYEKQATDFLKATSTTFKAEFLKYGKHFDSDTDNRDIYSITLTRGSREYNFNFGQSINCSRGWTPRSPYGKAVAQAKELNVKSFGALRKELKNYSIKEGLDFVKNNDHKSPTAYDVLSCLISYEVGTLEDFCDNFGYDNDSISANKIYKAVLDEYKNVCMLWNESEIELLQEIS